jgi:parvulin-like peptidyl-prolyl isomerase
MIKLRQVRNMTPLLGPILMAGLVAYSLIYSLGCNGKPATPTFKNEVIGTMDGRSITSGWLVDRFFEFSDRNKYYYNMDNETTWLANEAERFIAYEMMAEIGAEMKLDKEKEFKRKLQMEADDILIRDYRSHELYDGVSISEKDIKQFHDMHQDEYTRLERYEFQYISVNKTIRPRLEAKRRAEEALDIIQHGGDFQKVSREYSDIPFYRRTKTFTVVRDQPKVNEILMEAIQEMKSGEISKQVLEGEKYFYIIKMLNIKPKEAIPYRRARIKINTLLFREACIARNFDFREKVMKSKKLKVEMHSELLKDLGASGNDIVLAIHDNDGKNLLKLTLNEFYGLATDIKGVELQTEFLYQMIENLMINVVSDDEDFQDSKVYKYDMDMYKTQYLADYYISKQVTSNMIVSEEEIDKAIENPMRRKSLRQLRAYIIVKSAKISPDMEKPEKEFLMNAAQYEIWAILGKIRQGLDFRLAAKLYSDDRSTGRLGGLVGIVPSGPMGRRFDAAAFQLQEGEITVDPVEIKDGYMLIWVDRIYPAIELPSDIVRSRARDEISVLKEDELRSVQVKKFLDKVEVDWDYDAIKRASTAIQELDSDTLLDLKRRRYGLEY